MQCIRPATINKKTHILQIIQETLWRLCKSILTPSLLNLHSRWWSSLHLAFFHLIRVPGVTLDIQFTFDPHAPTVCVQRASKALNVMKALVGASRLKPWWPRIRAPFPQLRLPIRFTQVSSSHLGKIEVIQKKGLRTATGCHPTTTAVFDHWAKTA